MRVCFLVIVALLFCCALAHGQTYTLSVPAATGAYSNYEPFPDQRVFDFDFGMTFPRIAGVSVRWSGEIYPGTWVYWEPNDPYPPIPYYTSYPGSFGVVVCDDQGNWLGVDGVSSGQSEDPWPFSRESLLTPYPIGWDSLLTGRGQLRVTFDGYNPAAVQLAQGGLSSVEILVTVPEPAGLPVLLSGLGALGAALRRRR